MKKIFYALCAAAMLTAMCGCSAKGDNKASSTAAETLSLTKSDSFDGLCFSLQPDWSVDKTEDSVCHVNTFAHEYIYIQKHDYRDTTFFDDKNNAVTINSEEDYYNCEKLGYDSSAEVSVYENSKKHKIMKAKYIIAEPDKKTYDYQIYKDGFEYDVLFFNAPSFSEEQADEFIDKVFVSES